jgi:hypothetical protein
MALRLLEHELTRLADAAVWKMDRWMCGVVRGYRGMTRAERRSCAAELACYLHAGTCPCGLERCRARHDVRAQGQAGVDLPLFVEQAVIGPVGLCANSVAQGMFYHLILGPEHRMLVASVEFKRCTNPRCRNPHREYEEDRCPGEGCDSVYTPEETEVIARERLFMQEKYRSVRRWCCGGAHYFRQQLCRGELAPPFTEVHHRVRHGANGAHDRCPWSLCPGGRPPHPQSTGTTLWVRATLAGRQGVGASSPEPSELPDPSDPLLALRLEAHEDGSRRWLQALEAATARQLGDAIAGDATVAPEARDDPLVVAAWVFHNRPRLITAARLDELRAALRRALEERGLEE